MITVEIELYTADELADKHPEAFKIAHSAYVRDLWEGGWGVESITLFLKDIEEEQRSPLCGRELEWDLYRGKMGYASGRLTPADRENLRDLAPALTDEMLAHVVVDGGYLRQDPDWPLIEEADGPIAEVNGHLYDLYAALLENARDQEEYMESEAAFLDNCSGNDWTFEANGRMRNA